PSGVDDSLEVPDPYIQREVGDVPIRESAPALIVAHELPFPREPLEQRTPDGRPPVVLDVIQPVGGLHQRWTGTCGRKGEPDAIYGFAEADLLLHRDSGLGTRDSGLGTRDSGLVDCARVSDRTREPRTLTTQAALRAGAEDTDGSQGLPQCASGRELF